MMIQSAPPHLMVWACMLSNGNPDKKGWFVKCIWLYYLLRFSQTLQMLTQSILRKQPKTFLMLKSGKFFNGQVNHLTWSSWACVSLSESKTEGKTLQEPLGTEDSLIKGLAEHHQGRNPLSADIYAFQTSGSHWLQRTSNQVFKKRTI